VKGIMTQLTYFLRSFQKHSVDERKESFKVNNKCATFPVIVVPDSSSVSAWYYLRQNIFLLCSCTAAV